jgi:hypothetical protein
MSSEYCEFSRLESSSLNAGRRLYDEAFSYYSEYFCLNFIEPIRAEILHLFSIYMQIGKLSFTQGPLMEKKEEEKLTQRLCDLHEAFLYGELRQHDLSIQLRKILDSFCQNNITCQLISELMKLEHEVLLRKKRASHRHRLTYAAVSGRKCIGCKNKAKQRKKRESCGRSWYDIASKI